MAIYEYKCLECGAVTSVRLSLEDYSSSKASPVCLEVVKGPDGFDQTCAGETRRTWSPPSISIQ